MKRILSLSFILITTITLSSAQQTVKRSADINSMLLEKYSVLKSDKKVRQGEYTATTNTKSVVAHGNYTNGTRTGIWNFYARKGKLVQTFDYDHNKFTFLDTADLNSVKYVVPTTNPGDVLTVPIKIGGSYGINALVMARPDLQRATHGDLPGAVRLTFTHTLIISETGQVVDHIVKATGDNNMEKTYHLSDAAYDAELTRFIPATVNGQPVMSKVVSVVMSVTSGVITRTY